MSQAGIVSPFSLLDGTIAALSLAADHPWTRCPHAAARRRLGPGAPLAAREWCGA